ncbi:hypothetical protein [Absidia glauca]|uniref:DUF7137 domain-containing protein n=1 Tax=Absidia glauca TaxID=4829 RepID=A0A168PN70_ABSGL|nr:hypothetical protein [Absidia glauca]
MPLFPLIRTSPVVVADGDHDVLAQTMIYVRHRSKESKGGVSQTNINCDYLFQGEDFAAKKQGEDPIAPASSQASSIPSPIPSNSAASPIPSNVPSAIASPPGGANLANNSSGVIGNVNGGNGTQINGTLVASGNSSLSNGSQQANGNPFAGKPTSASFANNIPPAYLTWKKPIPNQTFPPLYKIGVSNMTLEWTVDPNALKVQPVNLTVALANPQKQTITAAIVDGTATEAYWDLAKMDPHTPLMVGYYTVLVYDQRGPKAFPSPGWLMPDSRLIVALYSTEAYVGRTDSPSNV